MTMRVLYMLFVSLTVALPFAQGDAMPKELCKYERAKGRVERVKSSAPAYSLDLSFGPRPIFFPPGTQLLVFKHEAQWSCVAGGIQTKQGTVLKAGWMQTSMLEPLRNDPLSNPVLQTSPASETLPEQIDSISGQGLLFLVFSSGSLSTQGAEQIRLLNEDSARLRELHLRVAFIKPPFMGKELDPPGIPEVQMTEHARLQARKLAGTKPIGFLGILVDNRERVLFSTSSPVSPQRLAEILSRSALAGATKRP